MIAAEMLHTGAPFTNDNPKRLKKNMKEKVYIFDFDGTLTTHDTLLKFIPFVVGRLRFCAALLLFSPLLVLMKLRLYSNSRTKERLFAHCFRGMPVEQFNVHCHNFALQHAALLRPEGAAFVREVQRKGHLVMIVSASIDNWVAPFFQNVLVLGTQIDVRNGRLTGKFLTPNCYGEEKVNRVKAVLKQPREHYYIVAFGDSRGDKELLSYADEAHFKPFRA